MKRGRTRGERTWSDFHRTKPKGRLVGWLLLLLGAWIGVYIMNVTGYILLGLTPALIWGLIVHSRIARLF